MDRRQRARNSTAVLPPELKQENVGEELQPKNCTRQTRLAFPTPSYRSFEAVLTISFAP
jgi:hypothetical protein